LLTQQDKSLRADLAQRGRGLGRIPGTSSLWLEMDGQVFLYPETGAAIRCGTAQQFMIRVARKELRFTSEL
jgi:hypothetical protein